MKRIVNKKIHTLFGTGGGVVKRCICTKRNTEQMQSTDITRLCLRLRHQGKTTCQTPHLTADIVSALSKKGDEVRATSVNTKSITLTINGQEVCIRAQSAEASGDHWYSVTANGKAVCLTPFHTDTVPTHVTDGMRLYPILEVLYRTWGDGSFPTSKADLLKRVTALTGIVATKTVSYPVSYVEVASFVDAIHLILEATSEA